MFNVLPSAVTPGSTTNTVVLAIILVLSSSSSEAEVGAGSDRPVSESGSVTHRGSSQFSLSQSRMSHWRWTVLESGNRNMEYRREVDTPTLGSNRNWVNTFLSGHLRQKDDFNNEWWKNILTWWFYPLLLRSLTELFLSLKAKQFRTLIPYLSEMEILEI